MCKMSQIQDAVAPSLLRGNEAIHMPSHFHAVGTHVGRHDNGACFVRNRPPVLLGKHHKRKTLKEAATAIPQTAAGRPN